MRLTDGAEATYYSKSFGVDQYTKPAYIIDISTDKESYYYNEQVDFAVTATYFDGTPVAGGRLRFYCDEAGIAQDGTQITLDSTGKALVSGKLNPYIQSPPADQLRSWQPQSVYYRVHSDDQQDVSIFESGFLTVLPSKIAAKIELGETDPTQMTISTAALDPAKLQAADAGVYTDLFDQLRGAAADLPLSVIVHKTQYKQVASGEYYDYVNKQTITRYKAVMEETVEQVIPTATVGGKVTLTDLPYETEPTIHYWFELRFDGGVYGDVSAVQVRPRVAWRMLEGQTRYSFAQDIYATQKAKRGEQLTVQLYKNGVKTANEGRIFYSLVQRKMLQTGMETNDAFQVTMTQEMLPNVVLVGAYFDGRHVYQIDRMPIEYDYSEKTLDVALSSDKPSYRPGETAKITVKVTGANGQPTAANACIGVVDEAVFAIAEQQVNLAEQMYRSIYRPNIVQNASYREYNLMKEQADSVGTGGGGGDDAKIRSNFVDTALFMPVTVDASGMATVDFKLPDNITSWRLTGAAVTDDLQAGDGKSQTIVTLPFYIRPLITSSYLVGDDVVFSAQCGGTNLPDGEPTAEYTAVILDVKGNEIDRLKASGAAGKRTVFHFGRYEEGAYRAVITGRLGEWSDGVEKDFSVIRQGVLLPVIKTMPVSELAGLKSADYPVRISLYDAANAPRMEAIAHLTARDGERTEAAVAAYRARVAFRTLMQEEEQMPVYKPERLEQLQTEKDGGVKLLPASGADPGVTARMLFAAADLLQTQTAQQYLQSVLKDPSTTPDDRAMAYAGLAAAGQPILLDINRMLAAQGDQLTPARRLYLGAALAFLGDYSGAEQVYASLGERLKKEGNLCYMEGDGTLESRVQTSAAALLLTTAIKNGDADGFARYLVGQDNDRARTDGALYSLELLYYVNHASPVTKAGSAKISYQLSDGTVQELVLPVSGCEVITLDAQGMQKANFTVLSGKVSAAAEYTVYAPDLEIAKSDQVSITKRYTPMDEGDLTVASRVKVELTVEFDPTAPNGCYNITDYIPSGMRFLQAGSNNDGRYVPIDNTGQTVFANIYRTDPEDDTPMPLEKGANDAPAQIQNHYTVVYYLSTVLPGSFVTEHAYITPYAQGISASSSRGVIVVKTEE